MNDFNVFIDDLPLWSAPFGLKLLDTLQYKRNINVLDIGCGEGFPINPLPDSTFFFNGWKQLVDSDKIKPVFDQIEARLNDTAQNDGSVRLTIPYIILDCRAA